MSVRTFTVTFTEAEGDALWSLASMAGDHSELKGFPHSSYKAGRRAMEKLANAQAPRTTDVEP